MSFKGIRIDLKQLIFKKLPMSNYRGFFFITNKHLIALNVYYDLILVSNFMSVVGGRRFILSCPELIS